MCGITARVGRGPVLDSLLSSLQRLEYRGYDSAGVALSEGSRPAVTKRSGDVDALVERFDGDDSAARAGIAHTRWSTHGPPTDANAHPHTDCEREVAVVHNGIIENHAELEAALRAEGHRFDSETDTEVVPHLIEAELASGSDPEAAFRAAVARLEGSYAVAALFGGEDVVYAARDGSPLVIGVDDGATHLASDIPAFIEHTDRVVHVHDGEFVRADADGFRLTDADGTEVDRRAERVDWDSATAQKAGFDHYMSKEIHEQPDAVERAIRGRVDSEGEIRLDEFPDGSFEGVERVHLVGMGTSYHAARYAASMLVSRGVEAQAFLSGEYAVVTPPLDERTLVVAVTQSGETADTLNAARAADDAGARTLGVTNVVGSSITRACADSLFIRAGPEIGVAATKTFSSQVVTLAVLVERLSRDVTGSYGEDVAALCEGLLALPEQIERTLESSSAAEIAAELRGSDAYFFIGRELGHPVALEGALKFKEISYEHAEGFAAAELKHGPLALVTANTPVFAAFTGRHTESTLSNVEEVRARGAPVVAVASEADADVGSRADRLLEIPETHPDLAGVLANVQLQLVSYHAANLIGRSIDKPRNLAKCVTVE